MKMKTINLVILITKLTLQNFSTFKFTDFTSDSFLTLYLVVSTVVPDIECDVRAGKINLQEFIVKCPARCKETRQQVYGTGVFASISSICNAAIHR